MPARGELAYDSSLRWHNFFSSLATEVQVAAIRDPESHLGPALQAWYDRVRAVDLQVDYPSILPPEARAE
jgi:hypothetical protein